MNNRDTLIDLMIGNHLERLDIAELLRVDVETVNRWLLPVGQGHETIPDMAIELLTLKLQQRTPAPK